MAREVVEDGAIREGQGREYSCATSSAHRGSLKNWEGALESIFRTSVGPLVSAHISEVDDMLAMQTLQEDGEAVRLDLADRHAQGLHPRGGNRQKGVCAHGSDSMPPMDFCPARALVVSLVAMGAVGVICLAVISGRMKRTFCRVRCSKTDAQDSICVVPGTGQRQGLGFDRCFVRRPAYEGVRERPGQPRQCSEAVICSGRTPVLYSPVRILLVWQGFTCCRDVFRSLGTKL